MTSFFGRSDVTGNLKKVPKDPLFFNYFFCGVFVGIISISRCADKCYRTSPGEREPPRRQTPQKRIKYFRSTLYGRCPPGSFFDSTKIPSRTAPPPPKTADLPKKIKQKSPGGIELTTTRRPQQITMGSETMGLTVLRTVVAT